MAGEGARCLAYMLVLSSSVDNAQGFNGVRALRFIVLRSIGSGDHEVRVVGSAKADSNGKPILDQLYDAHGHLSTETIEHGDYIDTPETFATLAYRKLSVA